jgi:hypothetical protein
LVIRPWLAGCPPDWRTRGLSPSQDRVKATTAATIASATAASISGTVISRNTSGRPSVTCPARQVGAVRPRRSIALRS